jgi:hypothetical protein
MNFPFDDDDNHNLLNLLNAVDISCDIEPKQLGLSENHIIVLTLSERSSSTNWFNVTNDSLGSRLMLLWFNNKM